MLGRSSFLSLNQPLQPVVNLAVLLMHQRHGLVQVCALMAVALVQNNAVGSEQLNIFLDVGNSPYHHSSLAQHGKYQSERYFFIQVPAKIKRKTYVCGRVMRAMRDDVILVGEICH